MELHGVYFQQAGVGLFATAIPAGELIRLARIDVYDPDSLDSKGYQRQPEVTRARLYARYLRTQKVPLAPTAILLNAREGLVRQAEMPDRRIVLRDGDSLWVIDGQHRLEGLRVAIEEFVDEGLRGFPVPVVIADGLSERQEAEQFRVINETAKKVRTDLARRLLALSFRAEEGRDQLRAQQRYWEALASELAQRLNSASSSPLKGRIQAPNQKKGLLHTVRELSFSTSLRPILTDPDYADLGSGELTALIADYWEGWRRVIPAAFDNPNDYVLLKTPGIFAGHLIALRIWASLRSRGQPTTAHEVSEIIWKLGKHANASYWRVGNPNGASVFGSMAGFRVLADAIVSSLAEEGLLV